MTTQEQHEFRRVLGAWQDHSFACATCQRAYRHRWDTERPAKVAARCCAVGRPLYEAFEALLGNGGEV
jgi:hypothetical protein